MARKNRELTIHIDPAFEDLGLATDRAVGRQALYYAGFDEKEIQALHLVDDPLAYEEQAAGLLGPVPSRHAVISIGNEIARWRHGSIEDATVVESVNAAIYDQLAALADETPRPRPLGSYVSLNFCSAYLSCATTFITLGIEDTAGIPPGVVNFGVAAAVGTYTAIKLGNIPDTINRQASNVRELRQSRSFEIPEVVSVS